MSTFVGDQLPETLVSQLGIDQAMASADRAIVICTIDEHGWPHPAMLSSLEVVARDARNVRLAIHARSRSARNMEVNHRLTLVVADERGVYYIKGDVRRLSPSLRQAPELARFNLRVDSVLADSAADYERARLVSGIRIEREALDSARTAAILGELLAE